MRILPGPYRGEGGGGGIFLPLILFERVNN